MNIRISKKILALIVIGILLVGVVVAVYLTQQQQDIRQRAAGEVTFTEPPDFASWPECSVSNGQFDTTQELEGCVAKGTAPDGKAVAKITNTTTDQTITVGFASYKAFQEPPQEKPICNVVDCPEQYTWLSDQEIVDSVGTTLEPGQTAYMRIDVPTCAWQAVLFQGDVLQSFTLPAGTYDGREVGEFFSGGTLCQAVQSPACPANQGACEWDPVTGATAYHYKVTDEDGVVIKEDDVDSSTSRVLFTFESGKTYTCAVNAVNACGPGEPGEDTATCEIPPSPTPTQSPTPSPSPTEGPTPTDTPTPTEGPSPTNTPSPTRTPTPSPTTTPTRTPTPTSTPVPPTGTPQPTNTPAPTNTPRPTNTPVPTVIAQTSPQPTLPPTGDSAPIILTIGAAALAILGGLLFFVL